MLVLRCSSVQGMCHVVVFHLTLDKSSILGEWVVPSLRHSRASSNSLPATLICEWEVWPVMQASPADLIKYIMSRCMVSSTDISVTCNVAVNCGKDIMFGSGKIATRADYQEPHW